MNLYTTAQGAVLLAVLLSGFLFLGWVSGVGRRHVRTKEEFLVASRRLTWKVAGPVIAANWIWATALFVAAQQAYTRGWVGLFWFSVPNILCLGVFAFFMPLARRRFPHGFTASAAARHLYSPRVQKLYAVGYGIHAVAVMAAQLLAGGLVLSVLTGIPFVVVTGCMAVIALMYSLHRGIGASIAMKLLQVTTVLVIGLGIAFSVAFVAGWDTIAAGMSGIDRNMHSLVTGPGAGVFWAFGLSSTLGLMSGPFGDQSFWQLGWATKKNDVKKAFLLSMAVFAIVPIGMGLLGLAAAGASLPVDNLQLTNLTAILHWLPTWVVIPFLVYIFIGLSTTVDSQINVMAAIAGNDIAGSGSSDERSMKLARIGMAGITVVGLALANLPGMTIVALFIFYGTVRSIILSPTIVMLTRKRLSERGTFWGMVAAFVVALPLSAYGNLTSSTPLIIAGSLSALGIALTGSLVGSLLEKRSSRDDDDERERSAQLTS